MLYANQWDYWQLYHKVTFDGVLKTITINQGEFTVDVKADLYSAWKEWMRVGDHPKFPIAFRTIGGDSIDSVNGIFAGDLYFLVNGWQIVIPHAVRINGVIYHDDPISPFVILQGGGVTSVVSNLTQTVVTTNTVPVVTGDVNALTTQVNLLAAEVAAIPDAPTAANVASAVRSELSPELAKITAQVDGLTPNQLIMLQEIYALYGLDMTKPLVVTDTARTAGTITQQISSTANQTTVTRV